MARIRWTFRNIEEIFGCFIVSVMVFAVSVGVFARFLGVSVTWTDELSRYSFIWCIFIGSIVAFKRGGHIASEFLIEMLPDGMKKFMAVLIQLCLLALFAYLMPSGITLVVETWNVPTTSLEIPTGMVYLVVPLSFFLSGLYTIKNIWKTVRFGYVSPVPTNTSA